MFVEQQRALGRPWSAIAKMQQVSEEDLRVVCDAKYQAVDVAEAARRTPPMASGRENRPAPYEPPPVEMRVVPPLSNAAAVLTPPPPRPEPMAQPGRAPVRLQAAPTPVAKIKEPTVQTPAIASLPSARAVAAAIVAAARVLDEDPLTLAVRPGGGVALRRFRFPAFAALRARYPGAPLVTLGRLTDLPERPNPAASLHVAQGSKWWAARGDAAMDAALDALDGLNA